MRCKKKESGFPAGKRAFGVSKTIELQAVANQAGINYNKARKCKNTFVKKDFLE